MTMDFNAWQADVAAGTAVHESGFILKVEGNPSNPSSVDPGKFPANLSFAEQARLLRCGMEFLAKAANKSGGGNGNGNGGWRAETATKTAPKISDAKSAAVKEREALAQRFAEQRSDKPKRSVLSLKKND